MFLVYRCNLGNFKPAGRFVTAPTLWYAHPSVSLMA
jgi:hypothetical protein